MDVLTISAALKTIKTAADIAKVIKESNASLERAETKLQLAELMSTLADAKIQLTEIQQLIIDKDLQIRSLQEQLALRESLVWEAPYYWLMNGELKDGPFCQHCLDANAKQARLLGKSNGYWWCTVCKNSYTDKDFKDPGMPTMFAVARSKLNGF
jgi:hypothetical protein